MTPEAQNEALAKAAGFYLLSDEETRGFSLRHPIDPTRYLWHTEEQFAWEDAPDYLNDLNALREIEDTLTGRDIGKYLEHLGRCVGEDPGGIPEVTHFMLIIAGAKERAEALLRTLRLWTD